MKNLLTLMLIVLSTLSVSTDVFAQVPGFGPGRPGHGGPGWGPGYGHGPGRPGFGDRGDRGGPHRPPMPPPHYSDVYGPAYTVRWQDTGTNRTEKIIDLNVYVNAQGQFVNELLLTAQDNMVQIKSAQARLANGQMVSLPQLAVTLGENQQMRIRLDSYYSLKIDQIILTVRSPNLFGSRGKLNVQLGLAY